MSKCEEATEIAGHAESDGDSDDIDDIGNIIGDLDCFTDIIDPKQNPLLWVQSQISRNVDPQVILRQLMPGIVLPDNVPDLSVWRLIFEIITEPSPRQRLLHISTLDNVIQLIKECKNILVLTGAGVSVSCGIPDFRSRNGIYARLSKDFPDLPDPQAMFDIHFFRCNPCPFFRFAKEIYPGRFTPSLSHYFIQHLEKSGKLLRNYTQNIDTLEQVAGINNVVHCHGSFATATCMNCKVKVRADDIEADVFAQKIPYCKNCTPNEGVLNILKPDIVFFGEGLPEEFHRTIEKDKLNADLLIVIGSSLKVRPVALIPSFLKPDIPQILINRERLPHMQFDVELYGNCDDVISQLCYQLGDGWNDLTTSYSAKPLDHEKYKQYYELINSKCRLTNLTETLNESCETDLTAPIVVNGDKAVEYGESAIFVPGSTKSLCGPVSTQQGTTSNYLSKENDDNGNPLKRNLADPGNDMENKHQKLQGEKKSTNQSEYYLFFPPNCYIFNGAELDCQPESEDDSDEENDCSVTPEYKDNSSCSLDVPGCKEMIGKDIPFEGPSSDHGNDENTMINHNPINQLQTSSQDSNDIVPVVDSDKLEEKSIVLAEEGTVS